MPWTSRLQRQQQEALTTNLRTSAHHNPHPSKSYGQQPTWPPHPHQCDAHTRFPPRHTETKASHHYPHRVPPPAKRTNAHGPLCRLNSRQAMRLPCHNPRRPPSRHSAPKIHEHSQHLFHPPSFNKRTNNNSPHLANGQCPIHRHPTLRNQRAPTSQTTRYPKKSSF